jgi:hypothetical protein
MGNISSHSSGTKLSSFASTLPHFLKTTGFDTLLLTNVRPFSSFPIEPMMLTCRKTSTACHGSDMTDTATANTAANTAAATATTAAAATTSTICCFLKLLHIVMALKI